MDIHLMTWRNYGLDKESRLHIRQSIHNFQNLLKRKCCQHIVYIQLDILLDLDIQFILNKYHPNIKTVNQIHSNS